MTTAVRTKENQCDFPLYKTPIRTPIRTGTLGSATFNDLSVYSNSNKHLKYAGTTNIADLPMYIESMGTPIRLNKNRFITPASIQRRRALGLVNQNSHPLASWSCSDDSAASVINKETNVKQDDSVILEAPSVESTSSHPEDDLPHSSHVYEDTFDDLIPAAERIEHLMINSTMSGINMFTFRGGIENTIRCQSPVSCRLDLSTLLDILN